MPRPGIHHLDVVTCPSAQFEQFSLRVVCKWACRCRLRSPFSLRTKYATYFVGHLVFKIKVPDISMERTAAANVAATQAKKTQGANCSETWWQVSPPSHHACASTFALSSRSISRCVAFALLHALLQCPPHVWRPFTQFAGLAVSSALS